MGIQERKERDFKRREEDILDAALHLFDRDDWQEVTIEEIAQQAEIGKGTVYLHFPSKEEIYARLAIDFGRNMLARLRDIDPALPVLARLREAIRLYFELHRGRPEYQHVVEYCHREDYRRGLSEATRREFEEIDQSIDQVIGELFESGMEAGLLPRRNLTIQMHTAHATLLGAVQLMWCGCLERYEIEPQDFIAAVTRFVLAGLAYQDQPLPGEAGN
jgi:AcrR family transcriptional regulator